MYKKVPLGARIEQPVELRDFLPTFIELAGGAVPPDMDGKSLLKLVQGQESEWRKYLDMEHATCYSQDNYWCALTDGKIKYVWNFHTGKEELFDLRKIRTNWWNVPASRLMLPSLRKCARQWSIICRARRNFRERWKIGGTGDNNAL